MAESQQGGAGEAAPDPTVRIAEKDGDLTIEMPRPGLDSNLGARLVGGVILLLVGLLRGWAVKVGAPEMPAVIVWPFVIGGALLLWGVSSRASSLLASP